MTPPPLIRRTVDVILGDAEQVARSIEQLFAARRVAAVCRVHDTLVKVEISTLDLDEKDLEAQLDAWVEQAAAEVAATIRWRGDA
jgi:uncharacterized membrane protein